MKNEMRYAVYVYHGKYLIGWTTHTSRRGARIRKKEMSDYGYIVHLVDLEKKGGKDAAGKIIPVERPRYI